MLEVYWGLLVGGAVLVLVMIVFGEVLDALFDGILSFLSLDGAGFIHPLTVIGGLTILGGMGVMLTAYTPLAGWFVFILSLCTALLLSAAMYLFYLKPMQQAENSLAYSMQELVGMIVEVSVPVPADGYGEVIAAKPGSGITHHIAASWDNQTLHRDTQAVVIEVKDGVLYVTPFDET